MKLLTQMSQKRRNMGSAFALICAAACSQTEPVEPVEPPPPESLRPNILLIDIDSLRADTLLSMEGDSPLAPNMHQLAQRGAFFSSGISQSGWTLPALASLLTGQEPPVFPSTDRAGGPDNKDMDAAAATQGLAWFSAELRTVPDLLRMYDYDTAVFYGQTVPGVFKMMHRGFAYSYPAPETPPDAQHAVDATHQPVLDWLSGAQQPFFALVHNIDLHFPTPRPPNALLHTQGDGLDCELTELAQVYAQAQKVLPEDQARAHTIAHYRGALRHYDEAVGAILAGVEALPGDRPTVVMVTSNHGELLFEHDLLGHGKYLYEEVLRIPLILTDPRESLTGAVSTEPFRSADIAPTLLKLAGVPRDHNMTGLSVLEVLAQPPIPLPRRPAYSISNLSAASVTTVRHKYLLHQAGGSNLQSGLSPMNDGLAEELYDLSRDPQELNNLSLEQPAIAQRLQGQLLEWVGERVRVTTDGPHAPASSAEQSLLKERGYWDAGGDAQGGDGKAPAVRAAPMGAPPAEDGLREAAP